MKALELLEICLRGEIDIERAGIADSDSIIIRGWYGYFGAKHYFGSIKPGEKLFYIYKDAEESLPSLPQSDVVLISEGGESGVYLWKIEND